MRLFGGFILLFFFVFSNSSAQGYADWQNTTPGGNIMYDAGSGTVVAISKTHQSITGIRSWYFYKQHILIVNGTEYIGVNEINGEVKYFASEQEWKAYLESNQLEPVFWTRWHSDNWKFYDAITFTMIVIIFPLAFIILMLTLFFWIFNWIRNGMKFRSVKWIQIKSSFQFTKRTILVLAAIICFLVIRLLLDNHPESW